MGTGGGGRGRGDPGNDRLTPEVEILGGRRVGLEEYGQEWVNGEASLAAQKELKGAPFTLLLRMGARGKRWEGPWRVRGTEDIGPHPDVIELMGDLGY